MHAIRRSAVAGTWYPGRAEALARAVDGHLARVADNDPSCPRAIVSPHAGLPYSGPVAAHAYRRLSACSYSAAVVIGPSHFVGFQGVSLWPSGEWETPYGAIPVARELAAAIAAAASDVVERPTAHAREHSIEMQLPFLARVLPGVPIVPLVMGYQRRATAVGLGHAVAHAVAAWERDGGGRALIVASSDLSHYEDADTAVRLDAVVMRAIEAFDPDALMRALEEEPRHACGGGPMVSVLEAARRLGATRARVLRYGDSGDVTGDKSSVVGYVSAACW